MKSLQLAIMVMLTIFGCASQTATEEAQKAPATKYDQGINESPAKQSQYIPCGQTNGNAAPDVINANRLYVTSAQGQQMSLCQALQQSGKSVAIFQVAGLLCISCQDEAKYVNRQQLTGIAHFLVFTDAKHEMDPVDVQNFRQMAPQSQQVFDHQKTLANDLNPGHSFGTVLVLHTSGKYKLYLSPGLESIWFPEAQKMTQIQNTGLLPTPQDQYQQIPPYSPQGGQQNQQYSPQNQGNGYYGLTRRL